VRTDTTNDLIDARLRAGGAVHFTISTWSMFPTLAPGDQVIAQRAPTVDLYPGDILLIQVGGMWLAHRLIGRRVADGRALFITKGDNALEADQVWQAAQLSGIVTAVRRNGRVLSLRSRRARWTSAALAFLSRAQVFLRRLRPHLARRIALKASRILLRIGARLVRWMM
jgi:hypothetical protein